MAEGGNIDILKFGVVLDGEQFKKEAKVIEDLASKFEKSVTASLAVTKILEGALGKVSDTTAKEVKETTKKAKKQKEVVTFTREELELKKAMGTITSSELTYLNKFVENSKKETDELKKQENLETAKLRRKRQEVLLEKSLNDSSKINTSELYKQNAIMKGLTSMAAQYFSVFGAATIVRNLVRITGEFEAQHTALRAILQDTAAADNIYNQLQVLAVKSPFTFQNLVGYAKQLTAFSVPVNEVYETTKKLADVSAGLGVDMGRIILAYGQVRSAEFLRGTEVRQFTEAGIPILKELADQFKEIEGHAISVGEVFERISARHVPFEMVEEAFNRMTSAGGKFYQMQEVLAETVKGKISNLQDAWEIMLSKIGDQNSGTIKNIVNGITGLLQNYEKWIGLVGALIKYLGVYAGVMATWNTIAKVTSGIQALQNTLNAVTIKQIGWKNFLLASENSIRAKSIALGKEEAAILAKISLARKTAVGAISALIAIGWTLIQQHKREQEEARRTADIIDKSMAKISASMTDFKIGTEKVDEAFEKMQSAEGSATQETKDFNKAVDDLKKQFPKFIDDNVRLAKSVDELGKAWDEAGFKMRQYFADEAKESAKTELKNIKEQNTQSIKGDFLRWAQRGMSDDEWSKIGGYDATRISRYISGDLSFESVESTIDSMIASWEKSGRNKLIDVRATILGRIEEFKRLYEVEIRNYRNALNEADKSFLNESLITTRDYINDYVLRFAWGSDLDFGTAESAKEYADRLRELYSSADMTEDTKEFIEKIFNKFPDALGSLTNKLPERMEKVNEIIRKYNETLGTSEKELTETDSITEKVKDWIKELNSTQEELELTPTADRNKDNFTYASATNRKSLLEALSMYLYGTPDFKGGTNKAKKETKDATEALKQELQDLKELKKWYDKLKEIGLSDTDIDSTLNGFFGRGIPQGGFDTAFNSIADKFRKLNKPNDARDVENFAAGRDINEFYSKEKARLDAEAKELEDYLKRIEKYKEEAKSTQEKIDDLNKQRAEDLARSAGDMDAATAINEHYNEEIEKLRANLEDLTSIQLTDFWQQLTGEKNGTYANLTKLQDKAGELIEILKNVTPNRNKDGKITGYTLTQKEHGDFLKSIGVDAESLQLSVAQVEALNKAFEGLFSKRAEKNGIASLIKMIKDKGFKDFWKQIKEGSGAAVETLSKASGELSQIGGMLTQIGEAAKSDTLQSLGEMFSFTGNFLGKLAKLDIVGAIGEIVNFLTSWITQSARLKAAIEEARMEAERFNSAMRLSKGVDTIFGENAVANIRNAVKEVKRLQSAVNYDKSKTNSDIVWKSGVFKLGKSEKSLAEAIRDLGYDLYDQYGNLNAEALNAILDTYKDLTDESREWVKAAIQDSELYADAMVQLNDAIKDTWGSIADDLTDKLITARIEVGDAYHALADDLRDTFGDMAEDIAKKLISSFISADLEKRFEGRLKSIYEAYGETGDEKGYINELASLAEDIKEVSGAYAQYTNDIMDAMESAGVDFSRSSQSLGNSIKGSIREDQADLLASYINAMRADISYGKTQREKIVLAVEGYMVQFTTLNDYAAKVQANTYDIAQSNRDILAELRSMMAPEAGQPALRVYM